MSETTILAVWQSSVCGLLRALADRALQTDAEEFLRLYCKLHG